MHILALLTVFIVSAEPRTAAGEQRNVLYACAESSEGAGACENIEPILLLNPVAPPPRGRETHSTEPDGADLAALEFMETHYRLGLRLKTLTALRPTEVRIVGALQSGCVSLFAQVEQVHQNAPKLTASTLLTDSPRLREHARRGLNAAENERVPLLLLEAARTSNAGPFREETARFEVIRLDGRGAETWVGTATNGELEGDAMKHIVTVVAHLRRGGSFAFEHVGVKTVENDYQPYGERFLLGAIDLDGDGTAELVFREHGKEGHFFVTLKRTDGAWAEWMTGGGSGC